MVVSDANVEVAEGQVVGLVGPNGAGKTTIMKMVLGLVAPTAGQIEILGTTAGTPGWGKVLGAVGSIIENPALYVNMSAIDNLRAAAISKGFSLDQDNEAKLQGLLALVGLSNRATDKPKRFSLGMKQRLAIATSMVGGPKLLLLDEPANGLDPAGIIEIRQLLKRLPEAGSSVLVSSHQLAELEQACDQVIVINQGQTVASGGLSELVAQYTTAVVVINSLSSDRQAIAEVLNNAGLNFSERPTQIPDHDEGHTFSVESSNSHKINLLLVKAGIAADSIYLHRPGLEQAFITITEGLSGDAL